MKRQIKKIILVLLTSLMVLAPISNFGVNVNQPVVTYAAKSTKKKSSSKKKSSTKKSTTKNSTSQKKTTTKKSSTKKSTTTNNNYNNTTNNANTNSTNKSSDRKVWIPSTGLKYHIKDSCSNMKNPSQVTVKEAEARGYQPCKRCYK